ncbi:MAG TPA: putative sugar O-methyltransferase [Alphaproteobacteria bacterium]
MRRSKLASTTVWNHTSPRPSSPIVFRDGLSADWGADVQIRVFEQIVAKKKELIERIRLIWWLSGWPIHRYTVLSSFPIFDPTYIRYQKMKCATPHRMRYAAPPILFEAGWREDGGVVNHDVAILQERMQFIYVSGVADHLEQFGRFMVLELGSGYGGMALAFTRAFPNCTYVLCDIPQVLAIAYAYLNVARPDAQHFVATTDGLRRADLPQVLANPVEVMKTPGFMYIPNYTLPDYEDRLRPVFAFNAMSLHEMSGPAIDYYCRTVPKLLESQSGLFFEVNTLPGVPNAVIDGPLKNSFSHCLEIDLPSLAFRPRIWSQDKRVIAGLESKYARMQQNYSLRDLFDFDFVFEWPPFDDAEVVSMIRTLTDPYVGASSIPMSVSEPLMGNHLRHIVRRGKGIYE